VPPPRLASPDRAHEKAAYRSATFRQESANGKRLVCSWRKVLNVPDYINLHSALRAPF
jgi:hypothetical protein